MNFKSLAPLLFLILLGGLAFYFINGKSTKTDEKDGDWVMHVENVNDIHRVFIADREGATADLIRDGKDWIYNNKYKANPNVMFNVLETISRIRMKNRPTSASLPNMIKTLSTQSKKVEVYGKNNKLLKAYYIGGITPDELGTYMIMEGSKNPYVMHIPMLDVSLGQRFFTGEQKWRDKTVFSLEAKDIASLSLEYPKRKNKSFKIKRNKGKWNVEPFFQTTRKIDKTVNQDLVESFLKEFKQVGAEAIETKNSQVEKTISSKEFCIIKILLTDGTTEQVNFFPILLFEDATKDKPKPVERYIAVNEKGDVFMTQHLVFKKVFWAYDFFF